MKVAIGYQIQPGPWGRGNQFAQALAESLLRRGDTVRFDLSDPDIDIVVLTDPRARSPSVSFGASMPDLSFCRSRIQSSRRCKAPASRQWLVERR